jgi:methyltransferase (TIGR00027 family)
MTDSVSLNLSGLSESLLVTLYLRAMESRRPDALIKDEKAMELVKQMSDDGLYDFSRIKLLHLNEANKLVIILRSRQFDRYTLDFLKRNPVACVVHIGCGLDTRFERVAKCNGDVEWYDLDLPNVIELRRRLFGDEGDYHHLVGCSVLEDSWIEAVNDQHRRPYLFVAEGVSMHLREAQNKALLQTLYNHFPGSELVFDAFSPIYVWVSNIQTAKFGIRTYWGMRSGKEVEKWGDGIQLIDEWGYLDSIEPRTDHLRWLRPIEMLFRTLRIYRFRLGEASG